MQKVRTTHSTFVFTCFFTLWREQFLSGESDAEHNASKSHHGKKHQIGRERPHFFGFQPPKKFMGSLPPSGTVTRAACFSTVRESPDEKRNTKGETPCQSLRKHPGS